VGEEEAPVLRVNHTLRAVPVKAGDQVVEVYYDLGALRGPLLVTLVSLAFVIVAGFAGVLGRGAVTRSESRKVVEGEGGHGATA